MSGIRIANTPYSWVKLDSNGFAVPKDERITYTQMLDELRDSDYIGTELGDWGYLPTEPTLLRAALQPRRLALVGALVPVALKYAEAHASGEAEAVKVAHLLAAVSTLTTDGQRPFIILADANGTDPVRTQHAGRISTKMGLSSTEWRTFTQGAERIARTVRATTGLPTVFHHHCGGYVETPDEIARFLNMTAPDLVGLVFDTGHYLYGSSSGDAQRIFDGLDRFKKRIWHVHFKDCRLQIAAQARTEGWDYFTAVQQGVFCELGRGSVPFGIIADRLQQRNYQGWIVVEQDLLPSMDNAIACAQRNRTYLKSIGF